MSSSQGTDRRQVNNLLHNLRGEQFRHQQNIRRSRTHLSTQAHNIPSLPPGLLAQFNLYSSAPTILPRAAEKDSASSGSWSGPSPPKSWIKAQTSTDPYATPAWRKEALAIVAQHIDGFINDARVPPLSIMCFRAIVSRSSDAEELRDLLIFVPQHLRRNLIRYYAIHSPLSEWKLNALLYPEGHADGEILIMGPKTSLQDDHFLKDSSQDGIDSQELDWESEEHSTDPVRHLILVSTRLPTSVFLTLPPTLTHIALIHLPSPVPLPRLTKLCPLLVLLDLSFNTWLQDQADAEELLEKVDWSRWSHLQVLGLRGCFVPPDLLMKLNKYRWDDVLLVH